MFEHYIIDKPDFLKASYLVGTMCRFTKEYTATLNNRKKFTFYKGNEVCIMGIHIDRFTNCIDGYVISFGEAVIPVVFLEKINNF